MRHATLDESPAQREDAPHTRRPGHAGAALRAELRHAVARAAAVWRDCGVEPGESVAIALADPAESLVACLGAAEAGGLAVVVAPASSPAEIGRLRSRAGWRFILAESREEQPAAVRDFVLTRAEWRQALEAAPAPPATESPATIAG